MLSPILGIWRMDYGDRRTARVHWDYPGRLSRSLPLFIGKKLRRGFQRVGDAKPCIRIDCRTEELELKAFQGQDTGPSKADAATENTRFRLKLTTTRRELGQLQALQTERLMMC